jgi:hypothetical protein
MFKLEGPLRACETSRLRLRLDLPIPRQWPYLGLLTVPDSGFAALRQPAGG